MPGFVPRPAENEMTSGSEIYRPTSDDCLGQPQRWTADIRASRGEGDEEEEKIFKRGEEEQASAVMGSKVESAPSSISSTLLGDYEYSVPSSTVQYYQYEYNTYPTIIRSKCLGSVLGPCLEEPISTRPFSIPGRDGLAQQWRSAEARRLSVLEARVLQAGQLGRYQELLVPPRMNGRLWQAWDSLPTFWIWRASHASLDGLDSSTNGSHDISWLA
ncbi:hypothetical protein M431DRAFT_519875 [Trichoderma harzianum CBS 226.95]|uniref:Uncharacterized protein n=1 Tax=Trichoderma harzianum CBS 226.95 TaxID=983964 RepID=A0A2T4ABY8_TRIHA|nr:hypothetical protein M431DRAFT_519875 [Trichoderma harzianum CBS 226.95]PTB54566.1 hypothetical protein M431DRAFT_519875 [Trichoderma harzianum CBS 226.95]